ncbi:hypothetical protein [Elongatibacter sediminis]|uniref:MerC domain-containing protein n=1 Tax=Elongatibacter sediminis TaxID=3119006 RepID=A0AAW9RJ12_9GAMM
MNMKSGIQVDLVYERSCPNVTTARTRLLDAFQNEGIQPRWHEWEVNRPETPKHLRGWGSPTILVNGKDVDAGLQPADGGSCRLYMTPGGHDAAPGVAQIAAALRSRGGSAGLGLATLPSVGIALLPKLTCPICWPAYAALLGAFGVNFVNYTPMLLPVLTALLALALVALAYRARYRRGYGPFWLGLLASGIILFGKFTWGNDPAVYVGSMILLGASAWNAWPRGWPARKSRIN